MSEARPAEESSTKLPDSRKRARSSRHGMEDQVEEIMFGFGDAWPPQADAVDLMEKMAVHYIRDLCGRALQVANVTGKLDKECFLFQVNVALPSSSPVLILLLR